MSKINNSILEIEEVNEIVVIEKKFKNKIYLIEESTNNIVSPEGDIIGTWKNNLPILNSNN